MCIFMRLRVGWDKLQSQAELMHVLATDPLPELFDILDFLGSKRDEKWSKRVRRITNNIEHWEYLSDVTISIGSN
jgi:hypothetical protein